MVGLMLVVLACAAPVWAAVRYVDGGCPTTGNGTTLTCGASGPFRTIGQGVLAMQPGDTLEVRGAHDNFEGAYFEALELRNGAPLPGKALPCTAAARCTIRGWNGEVPVIRGMTLRPWTSLGSGQYSRIMEASPNPDDLPPDERDTFDPGALYQGTTYPLTPLGYAGDNVTAPADGRWSYFPTTHEVRVNPIGSADPNVEVYVPHFGTGVRMASPTANVTLAYLDVEGPRQKPVQLAGNPGVVLSHLRLSYWNQHGIHSSGAGGAAGLLIEDSIVEYGGRGVSWAASNSDTAFAMRLFAAHGGIARRNTIRHIGSSGQIRLSCGTTCTNAHRCLHCDAPWDTQAATRYSMGGVAYQVKQTDGFTLEENLAEDVGTDGMEYDVSRHVVAQRNTIRRAGSGFGLGTQTPTSGCPSTASSQFCYDCDDDFLENTIEDTGGRQFTGGSPSAVGYSIHIPASTQLHAGCSYVARVLRNTIINPGSSPAISGQSSSLITIADNTVISGTTSTTVQPPSTSSSSTTTITSTTSTSISSTSSTSTTTSSTVMCPSVVPCP